MFERENKGYYVPASVLGLFQEGGELKEMPEQDPMAQVLEMAMQAVQNQDADMAMMVCQALVEMAQGAQPAEEAPMEEAPQEMTPAPMGKKGMMIDEDLAY